jgi:hypothetical protein
MRKARFTDEQVMTLSGWTRLWILIALVWWGIGAVWLTQSEYPITEGDADPGAIKFKMPALAPETTGICTATFPNGVWASREACLASFEAGRQYRWGRWFADSWSTGAMPLVLFGPLVLGGLMMGAAWVRRGFGAPSNKG